MLRSLKQAGRKFLPDERGNIFVLFGALAVPLLLVMGGAIDVARYARHKAELANAVDAAALALARKGREYTDAQATEFVTEYVSAFSLEEQRFAIAGFQAEKIDNGFIVTADAAMQTIFLPLGSLTGSSVGAITSMGMQVLAEVRHSSNRLELALVLDNTGSMNCGSTVSSSCVGNWSNPGSSSRIVALKEAAHTLLDVLMTDEIDPDMIKVAVVPFEGTVNIGSTYATNPPSWVDWSNAANAKYTGRNFGKYDFTTSATCTSGSNCVFVGHRWLFDKLTANDATVKWEGCVEMRAEPYDILDTTPDAGTPDTLFVPFFWPDEPDSDNDNDDNYTNNYLNDRTTSNGSAAQMNLGKFLNIGWQSGKKDASFPFESGPNYGCPRPILPLTNDKTAIETAIDSMVAYYAMGTFIPNGLVWGWHVLSPTEPFTEGLAPGDEHYEKTVKAVVVLSDGENFITGMSNHNKSIFSGYNYTNLSVDGSYRLGSSSASTAMTNLNARTAALCTNAKGASIRLYTITFGSIPQAAQDLMRDCASEDDGVELYYHAPGTSDLQDIFHAIGEDLSEIHLSM